MEVRAGFRIVRGPDWCSGDQDGGEGHVGTVVDVDQFSSGSVTVQWDCGNRSQYRCGGTDCMYDLRVWDTAPAGCKFCHSICDGCRFIDGHYTEGVSGMLWRCTKCCNYGLCTACYMAGKHCLEHKFNVQLLNTDPRRISVPARVGARRIEARGIFSGAEVARGCDWVQDDSSDGSDLIGKVVDIQGWQNEAPTSAALVEWGETHKRKVHRVGYNGKVDLLCTVPAAAYLCYLDHLPVLGAPHIPLSPGEFASGDLVRVVLDLETFKHKQLKACIEWQDKMAEMIGRVGIIHSVADFGALSVQYTPSVRFYFSADAVVKEGNGNTALHFAVIFSQSVSVAILLDAGADATWQNFTLDSPVHLAARNGNLPAMEEFIKRCPAHVFDVRSDSGLTPMLMATEKGHGDIAALLAKTDIIQDMKNALWVAVYAGFPKVVELLVGYGANLNATDADGVTALHMLLAGGPELCMHPISDDMTRLKEIHDELLHLNFGRPVESYVTVACFLVCEGADRYLRDKSCGVTPFQACPPEVGAIVTTFQRRHRHGYASFHGSLCNSRITLKQDSIITDEVGNEERNKHTTSRDLSKSHSLVKAEKHAESPTSEPKLQLAASNEEFEVNPTDMATHAPASSSSPGNKALNAEDHLLVVLQKLSTVCQSWYYIGLMLRIRVDKLDCIKLEHHEPRSCMVAMVNTWLQGVDPQPTWDALIQALHSCIVGEDQVAEKLALELKTQQIGEKLTATLPSDGLLGIHHLGIVLEELYPARAKWYFIGMELEIPISTLNSIDKPHSTDKDCLCELLQCWLKGVAPRPSLVALIKALRDSGVDEYCLAQKLAQQYHPQLMDTHATTIEDIPVGKLPPIVAYSKQLKKRYQQKPVFPDSDWPPTINTIKSYIPLSLTKVDKHEETQSNILQFPVKTSSRIVTDKVAWIFSPLNDPRRQDEPIRVLIDGSPGVGKTTLCRKVSTDWANGLEVLRKYKLVVLLQLRDKRIAKAQCINDLFDHKSDVANCVENSNGRDILMLLDGFEELHYEERSDSLIADIIHGEILSECSLVVTSRPYASTGLLQLESINRHVRILGFTKECMIRCVEESARGEELLATLKEQQDIMAFMQTPLLCAIFLYVCANKKYLPRTQTDLFTQFVINAINRHLKSHRSRIQLLTLDNLKASSYKKDLDCLCKFALDCLMEDKLVFHYEDLLSAFPHCTDDDIETHCFGLLSANRSYTSSCEEVKYEFLHQLLQDYLAARCILTSEDIDQVMFFEKHQENIRFHHTLIFFAGLSKLQSTEFQRVFEQNLDLIYGRQAETFLLLIRSAFDSENHQLNQLLSKGIYDRVINLQCSQMMPYDCKALVHFMSSSDCKWKSLHLPSKGLDDFSLEILQRSCEALPHCYSSVEMLDVGQPNLHHMRSEDETMNAFSLAAINIISNAQLFASLKVLKLTVNQSCSECVLKVIKDVLKKNCTLQELDLRNSGIDSITLQYIADGLASNGTLKLLDIGREHSNNFCCLDDFSTIVNLTSANFLPGVSAATKLFEALQMNKCLEKLSCALQLDEEELQCCELLGNSLEHMLAENKSVRSLELATFAHGDNIKCAVASEWPQVTEGLVAGLSRNSSVYELQLDSLLVGSEGATQDVRGDTVISLDRYPPYFAPYSFIKLFHAAEKHCSLAKLTIWGTLSEKEEIEAVVKAIGSNQKLRLVVIKTYSNVSDVQSQLAQCPGIRISHLPPVSERNVYSESGIINYSDRQFRFKILSERADKSENMSIISFSYIL